MTSSTKSEVYTYITYRNAARRGPRDGHRQHAQKGWRSSTVWFSSYASGQRDKIHIRIEMLRTLPRTK